MATASGSLTSPILLQEQATGDLSNQREATLLDLDRERKHVPLLGRSRGPTDLSLRILGAREAAPGPLVVTQW